MSDIELQLQKMRLHAGFIAALDQSGGSTPKALQLYGIDPQAWSNEREMYDIVHQMRTRIITSPAFGGDRILGAILFENTMERRIDSLLTADYLWNIKNIVPFLKIDKGLAAEAEGVQPMAPMPRLAELLRKARVRNIFGTKMRSVIKQADPSGIAALVVQQFTIARQILDAGLVPIIEPEVTISIADKPEAENILLAELRKHLDALPADRQVMLKLTLPTVDNLYKPLVDHPCVMRVVALSGGYSRDDANKILARNSGVIASFSRALTEGLSAGQDDPTFNKVLDGAIQGIRDASVT